MSRRVEFLQKQYAMGRITIERLDAALSAGSLTQEEYNEITGTLT